MATNRIEYVILISVICFCVVKSHILQQTAFIIMSQDAHDSKALAFKDSLEKDLKDLGVKAPTAVLLHKDLPILGGWSVLPILEPLLKNYSDDIEWFVFLHESSNVDVNIFEMLLQEYDASKEVFLGKALYDRHPVIIHFYEENLDMKYPDFSAGFALSRPLVRRLSAEFQKETKLPLSKIQYSKREGYLIGMLHTIYHNSYQIQVPNS